MKLEKSLILTAFGVLLAAGTCPGKSTYWVGGHGGNWSEPLNWSNGAPANKDKLYITNTVSDATLALTNDIAGLTLDAAVFGEGGPIEFCGEKLAFSSYDPWRSYCTMVSYVPLVLTSPTFQWKLTLTAQGTFDQYASVEFLNEKGNVIKGVSGPNYTYGPDVRFHDVVICTNTATCSTMSLSFGATTTRYYFDAPVNLSEVCGSNSGDANVIFNAANNEIDSIRCGFSGNVQLPVASALPTNCVLGWLTGVASSAETQYQERYVYAITANQTVDRLSQPVAFEGAVGSRKNYCRLRQGRTGASSQSIPMATLTLRGTADATAYVEVMDNLSLAWDPVGDYTQTFAGAASTTYAPLYVKRGTLKLTDGASFKNVPSLTVSGGATFETDSAATALPALTALVLSDGATFKVDAGAATEPFTAGQVEAVLSGGASFALANGVTASLKTLFANGIYPTNGTYTAANAAWIEGEGSVTVTDNPTDAVCWQAAAGGKWNDAANWVGGVPSADKRVYLLAEGATPYEIEVDAATVLPKKLCVGGSHAPARLSVAAEMTGSNTWIEVGGKGRISIVTGGAILYSGLGADGERTVAIDTSSNRNVPTGSPIKICGGGEIAIEGGAFAVTNMTGYLEIGDGGTETATLSMTAGRFSYALCEVNCDTIRLRKNGFMDFSGGSVQTFLQDDLTTPDLAPGARVLFRGTATWDYPVNGKSYFLCFGDTSRCFNAPPYPYTQGHTGTLSFDIRNPCRARTTFGSESVDCPYAIRVGYNSGSARLCVSNAFLGERKMGLYLASQFNTWQTWTLSGGCSITGAVDVLDGGVVSINGAGATEYPGYGKALLQGLMVGYGAYASAYTKFDGAFRGEMTVKSGGIVTNLYGDTCIGVGYGTGSLTVDGGRVVLAPSEDWRHAWDRTVGIGLFGGTGVCAVDGGGSLSAHCDVYVGGVQTNRFVQGVNLASANCPVSRHTAQGLMSVSDGSVVLEQNLIVGADGNGVIEMRGSAGRLDVGGDLILSNAVENAASGGELRFTCDAGGVAPMTVKGDVILRANAKLTVDATAFTPGKWKYSLLEANTLSGSFASAEVTVAPEGTPAELRVTATGVDLIYPKLRRGFTIIMR